MSENKKILVLGESCIDESYYCDVKRLEPSCGVPVLDVIKKVVNPGMAGNLTENIRYLGGNVDFITNENSQFLTKTRLYEYKTNHFYLRFDKNNKVDCIKDLELIDFSKYAAIVVSDYNKGYLSNDQLQYISEKHNLIFLDSKRILGSWASKFTFIKINRAEYKTSEDQIKFYSLENKIIQTLGEGGCEYQGKIYPVKKVDIRNLIGAGDAAMAGLVINYLKTKNIHSAIEFANEQATIAVSKGKIGLYN